MRLLFLFALLFSSSCFSQSIEKRFAIALDTLSQLYPREKVYVQTDRDMYTAGETIWFKCHVVLDDKPTFLSKVLYVEFINEAGQLVDKRMYKLINGIASGDFKLQEKLASGTYLVHAYTKWMQNFEVPAGKHIFVINSEIKKSKLDPGKLNMDFYPEGGKLVAGVESVIGFRSTGENNLPATVNGEILDSKNKSIVSFSTVNNGLGSFRLTPLTNEKYVASVILKNGEKKLYPLPVVLSEGIVVSATTSNPSKIFVRVDRGEVNKQLYNELVIAGVNNQRLVYVKKLNIDEGLDAVAISKKDLPPGVIDLVVFDNKGEVLGRRAVFVNNVDISKININPIKNENGKRKLHEYALDLSGIKLPVSVVALADINGRMSDDNIVSYLLLNNDLKGYIHNGTQYLNDTSRMTELLLLTSTSNLFDPGKVLKKQYPKLNHIVESGLQIAGQAVKPGTSTPVKTGRVNLWIEGEDSTSIIAEAPLTEQGLFTVTDLDFRKSAKVRYQATNSTREQAIVELKIYPSYFDTLKFAHAKPLVNLNPYLTESTTTEVDRIVNQITERQLASNKVLQEIKIKGKKKSPLDSLNQLYASDMFVNSDQTFAPDSNTNYIDMWQMIRSRIPGITIRKSDTGTQVYFNRYFALHPFTEEDISVQFFLNEVPVTIDVIEFLNPNDVALIKSYAGATAYLLGATNGAISVYTRKGLDRNDWRKKGFAIFEKTGYSLPSSFPMVDHTDQTQLPDDNRVTLFWEPNVKPASKGSNTIKFYTNDYPSKLYLRIEGIDADGNLIFMEK